MRTSPMNNFRLWFCLGFLLLSPFAATAQFKQLAGGADEIAARQTPTPETLGTTSKSAVFPVRGGQTIEIPVDNAENFKLMLVAPNGDDFKLSAAIGGEQFFNLRGGEGAARSVTSAKTNYGFDGDNLPAEVFTFGALRSGNLLIKIDAPKDSRAVLVATSETPYKIYSYVDTVETVVGGEIGLRVSLRDYSSKTDDENYVLNRGVRTAEVLLTKPDGEIVSFNLDNQDGALRGGFTPATAGKYTAQIVLRGTTPEGFEFVRTAEHLIQVVDGGEISNAATAKKIDALRWRLAVPVSDLKRGQQVLAFAEVWSQDRAVAWIGGMTNVERGKRGDSVALNLDARWLQIADAKGDYELRNVRLQDPNYFVTLAAADRVALPHLEMSETAKNYRGGVTEEMRVGKRPANLVETNAPGGKLLLVHGYCSASNPWNPAQFADSAVFLDASANRTHDQFAQRIRNFGAQFPSFGIVAHSQGGAASLHLYTYYWSGLDSATGSRLIQSVGTPYQGTSLAGNLALIGSIFGAGCGSNYDLTYNGSAAFLANIPSWARAKVFYHTTSFTDLWYRYDYCNIASDVVLSDPDDGVIERAKGQLPGAVNLGHKTGWCHTSGMRDPAQTSDTARNSNMNAFAAR